MNPSDQKTQLCFTFTFTSSFRQVEDFSFARDGSEHQHIHVLSPLVFFDWIKKEVEPNSSKNVIVTTLKWISERLAMRWKPLLRFTYNVTNNGNATEGVIPPHEIMMAAGYVWIKCIVLCALHSIAMKSRRAFGKKPTNRLKMWINARI